MKIMQKIGCSILLLSMLVTGCGKGQKETSNNVEKVLQEQVKEQAQQSSEETIQQEKATENLDTSKKKPKDADKEAKTQEKIDCDFTQMGKDMVYATVYQMMTNPQEYEGKMIKMRGLYDTSYYEETDTTYHFCIIKDATACCSQGLEFVWEDGTHKYPEEYPEKQEEIEVTGIFEVYQEEGDENKYCRLKDASMEVIKE